MTRYALDQTAQGYSIEPEDADISLVEFVSYTCPHCRSIHETVLKAVEQDGKVTYVPRPLPSNKVADAQMAYAAGLQGQFLKAHSTLLTDGRILDEGGLMVIADSIGLDTKRLAKDMKSDHVIDQVNRNIRLLRFINSTRTPTFVINKKQVFVPEGQMPSVQDFLTMFEEARQ